MTGYVRPRRPCTVCGRLDILSRGFCGTHYTRWQKHGDPLHDTHAIARARTCSIGGCGSPHEARGLCQTHYSRLRVTGSPHLVKKTAEQRFWERVDKAREGGCWIWTGGIADTGYGTIADDTGRWLSTHRFAYQLVSGPIPKGLELDHLCRVRACCNPAHLEPVTRRENTRRASMIGYDHPNAPRTCKRGHDWSVFPPDIAHRSDGSVSRRCGKCRRDRDRRRAERRAAA